MKPRYTDSHKYPNGYTPSQETNINRTFDRVRRELKAKQEQQKRDAEEAKQKVAAIRRKA